MCVYPFSEIAGLDDSFRGQRQQERRKEKGNENDLESRLEEGGNWTQGCKNKEKLRFFVWIASFNMFWERTDEKREKLI